ncbi:hypothetical protein [Corynebacterium sp.]|uniref:hypothetical protein n=1 Tax=Corynebacterium sp. TaxID=1720 RepID=UPI003B3B1D16
MSESSLKGHSNPTADVRLISQSNRPIIVIEGRTDEYLLRSFDVDEKFTIKMAGNRNRLKKLVEDIDSDKCVFLYDRDFEDIIPDPRAIPYPGADREAFICDSVGMSVIEKLASEGKDSPVNSDVIHDSIVGLSRRIGLFKSLNYRREWYVRFDDWKWVEARLKKASRQGAGWEQLPELVDEAILNSDRSRLPENFEQTKFPLYSGKDYIFALGYFLGSFSNSEYKVGGGHHAVIIKFHLLLEIFDEKVVSLRPAAVVEFFDSLNDIPKPKAVINRENRAASTSR